VPLRRMLEGGVFDPKSIVLLLEVFDEIVAKLDLRTGADRRKAAKIVMRLALGQSTLDATKIRDEAVRLLRKKRMGRRRPLYGSMHSPDGKLK